MTSIVIAAHNEGERVRRTVDSLQAHTAGDAYEIVLVDDGSSDGSFAFLDEPPYHGDPRLRRFRLQQSAGCIRARHQGVRLARGEMIAFLDAHVAAPADWLPPLLAAAERWGPYVVVTPAISGLDEETWAPLPPTGQVMSFDEKLDFAWVPEAAIPPSGLAPTVVGCFMLMPRRFYYQIGGFDLGLRRWGCEFMDLVLKAYAAGGACYHEPSVTVGHLFRSIFPYEMSFRDIVYNKLRTGYVHLSDGGFRVLYDRLSGQPGFPEAMAEFRASLGEIERLRARQVELNRREPDWFAHTFIPGLAASDGNLPPGSPR